MLTREDPLLVICVSLAGKRRIAPSEVTEVTSLKSIPIFVFNGLMDASHLSPPASDPTSSLLSLVGSPHISSVLG